MGNEILFPLHLETNLLKEPLMKIEILKSKKIWTIALIVAVLYAVTVCTVQIFRTPKIGYINTVEIMNKYPAALKAKAELESKTGEWKKNIQTLEDELNKLNKEMMENGSRWSKQELQDKEKVMKQKQADYNRYVRAIQEKANQTETELTKPVFSEINAKIESFGKDKGYDLILGTMSGGNILYAHKSKDLTDEFIEYTKKK